MPGAAHPAPPRALTLRDHRGTLAGTARGQLARSLLGGVDFVEIMYPPADPAGRATFDCKIWILRHYFKFLMARPAAIRSGRARRPPIRPRRFSCLYREIALNESARPPRLNRRPPPQSRVPFQG